LIALTAVGILLFIEGSLQQKLQLIVAALVLCATFLVAVPHELKVRYATIFSSGTEDARTAAEASLAVSANDSTDDRKNLLKDAIVIALHHPVFGVGAGNFAPYKVHTAHDAGQRANWNGTHNTYAEFLSEEGFPGAAIFIAALVLAFKETNGLYRGAKKLKSREGSELTKLAFTWLCVLTEFAVVIFFMHGAYDYNVAVVMGISAALAAAGKLELTRLQEREREVVVQPAFSPTAVRRRLRTPTVV